MYKNLLYLIIAFLCLQSNVFGLTIIESQGWFESAYVTWSPVENVDSFSVYVNGEGISNQRIDDQLIRNYGTFYRADIPGLAAGTYTFKVMPIVGGSETEGAETGEITVRAHDRSGFCFVNDRVPGAYQADGTLRDGAVVLYITENTKNTVSLDVTGADDNPQVGLQYILEGFKKGKDNRPLVLRFVGQLTDLDYMDKGDLVIDNKNNASGSITFEGVGDDATIDGFGIRIKNASNVEIRNLAFMNTDADEPDDLGLQQENDFIWIHHCDFFYGGPGGDSDQAKGDGALDVKRSTYVTIAYNHFWDTGKSNLLGLGENTTEGLYATYHHNWYDHSDSRHPRVRFYSAHVYNNYYDGVSKYGVGATEGSSVFVEANYFRNCKYPMLISMQGSDVYDESAKANEYSDMPTFSKEAGGIIKAYNNYMTGHRRFIPYGDEATTSPDPTVDFDAYVVESASEQVPATVKSYQGGNAYNNFDTDASVMYVYSADSPEDAQQNVLESSGRMFGGDFQWTFDNSTDDQSYAVNSALKNALLNYQTTLVSIQGDGDSDNGSGSGGDGGGDTGNGEITGDIVHNFTLSGMESEYFTITGNLSDTKGTVIYGGLTLTQCLKIESATKIEFILAERANLTLVFNSDFNKEIKVDDVKYSVTSGVVTISLEAGSHVITKDDSANLYLISLELLTTGVEDFRDNKTYLYPNPVENICYLPEGITIQSIEIYSLNGELAKRLTISERIIDLSALKPGIYLLKGSRVEGGIFTQRFVKL